MVQKIYPVQPLLSRVFLRLVRQGGWTFSGPEWGNRKFLAGMPHILVCLLAFFCWVPSVLADSGLVLGTNPDFLVAAPTNVSKDLRMQTDFGFVGDANFSNDPGRVSVSRASLSADYSIFHLSYQVSHFFWGSKGEVASSFGSSRTEAPWDNLHDITLNARLLNNQLGGKWRYWVNGAVNSSFEKTLPGAVGVGFDGGVAYDFWHGWMLGITAKTVALSALNQDLFGDVEFGLALAVSQKTLRDTLQLFGIFEDIEEGSHQIGLNFAFSRVEKTYRLASDNPVYDNGYLGLVSSKVGAYVDYLPNDNLTLSIGPEYHYARKYKLYNKTGSYKSSHNLDNALGGYMRILWKF